MQGRLGLWLLLFAHVTSAGLLGLSCWTSHGRYSGIDLELLPLVALLSVTLGQACLLGIWAAFARQPWRMRLGALIAGAASLEVVLALVTPREQFNYMASIAAAVIAAVLLASRANGAALRLVSPAEAGSAGDGFRWSIRGLMLFTMAVGLAFATARGARETIGQATPMLALCAVWSLILVGQGLGACWATLGQDRPRRRVAAVLLCSAAMGALFGYAVHAEDDWKALTYITTVNAAQSAVVIGSLLVARSAGYRIVGRLGSDAAPDETRFDFGERPVPEWEVASTG